MIVSLMYNKNIYKTRGNANRCYSLQTTYPNLKAFQILFSSSFIDFYSCEVVYVKILVLLVFFFSSSLWTAVLLFSLSAIARSKSVISANQTKITVKFKILFMPHTLKCWWSSPAAPWLIQARPGEEMSIQIS